MYRLTVKIVFFAFLLFSLLLFVYYFFAFYAWHLVMASIFGAGSGLSLIVLMPPVRNEKSDKSEPCHPGGIEDGVVWIYAADGISYMSWYNAVSKEVGPCRLIRKIPENSSPRLLVLPKGAKPSETEIDLLSKWLAAGTSLLCECPDNSLAALCGIEFSGRRRECSMESFLNSRVDLTGAIRLIYESLGKGRLGETKYQELLHKKEVGQGYVFTLTLEYSEWARNITQGKPNRSDGKFSKRIDWNMQGIQTPDLRTDHPKPFAFVPVLDVFDQTLFGYVKDKLRIPAWWYYPEAYSSAFVLTFDEDWFGNKTKKIFNKGAPATWFVVDDSDIDTEAIDYLRREGDTIQFHWNRFLIHLNKFGLHFCRRKAKEQVDKLEKKAAIRPFICRIHYLRWDTDFDNLFFVMKEAGIKVDSSFGPGRGQHGYRFGTGFPYFVSDKEGRPIGIEEIPFQIHEPMGGASSEDHLRLIEEAERHFHTTVVCLFHPYYCLEGSRSYESFTELLNYLDKKPIWKTNLETLTNYWDKRRKTKILSFFENRNLIIEVSGLDDEGMTLRLPDLENMEKIALDGKEISVQEKLILDGGEHSIEIGYQN